MMQAEVEITRTGTDNFAVIRVDSVFPVGSYETDNYTQCLTRLYHNTIGNTPVSASFRMKEGVGGAGMAIPFTNGIVIFVNLIYALPETT